MKQIIEEMKKCSLSESSSSSDESSASDFEGDFKENLCFNCKSKYTLTRKQLRKIAWVRCDKCDHSFALPKINLLTFLPVHSLFHMKITASVTKSSHQDRGLSYLHLPIFFLNIHSPLLRQNKKFL